MRTGSDVGFDGLGCGSVRSPAHIWLAALRRLLEVWSKAELGLQQLIGAKEGSVKIEDSLAAC
ncbi:MAG: hypothetical protein JNL18_04100 [Planctomycetaceae bacterium]|jgi:hypothetical protein|uniref:Uncharacterized protein n=1 Tax=Lacipirellula limnantheis TaxID=2528024 RepID=A0A517U268_9BACT|nr:hypothetical protein [Planctomycetaceae bacterium]QDT74719.1 hypothetical protein I41_39180 [Lacipirellula limnantheis]